ncbi:unnamed protein product [Lepeophtheirus salmonis]|uniref:(salmon louse) hypothetical protein n=1 Tax=Lepeophtheirus salmonis TaxID=72036 RepID=A0A7R8CUB6_LEPSM|nr:unnamed protein product [Lepeophtheirus salmonis]CAF2898679.1 unnamed protein product [Lepeophtheirus salmonis]
MLDHKLDFSTSTIIITLEIFKSVLLSLNLNHLTDFFGSPQNFQVSPPVSQPQSSNGFFGSPQNFQVSPPVSQPQSSNRFLGSQQNSFFPQFNTNNPHTILAGAGIAGTGLLAASNIFNPQGNNGKNGELSIRPTIGAIVGSDGRLKPNLGAAVQVGNNDLANPTFNVGASLDNQNPNGFTPFFGSGLSVGPNNGGLNPAVNTGFEVQNGQANPFLGGSLGIGSFNLGNIGR